MKLRDRYLTGFLLLLIGILIGTLLALYHEEPSPIYSDVEVTEVRKDTSPMIPDSTLQKMGPRFMLKEVVHRVRPAVVYIDARVEGDGRRFSRRMDPPPPPRSSPEDDSDDNIWDRLFPNPRVRTVGSGVVISPNGYIVTNNHVIEGAVDQGIQVTLYDKRQFEATVVGRDPSTDLAVLKIPVDNLSAVTIGDSDQIEVGEWVLAIGNPFRLKSTVTAGIISAMHRNVQIIDIENDLSVESFIQTDAAINKGNSGGALVNAQGRLIGINTAIASQSGSYQGYGFAVPVNLAIKVAEDLIEYGEVKRALLGIRMEAIDYDRSRQLGLEKVYGVEIMEILEGSSAAQAGLKMNDAILAIGDEIIEEPNELQQEIAERRPGDIIKLTLWRDQEKIEKKVRLKSLENTQKLLAGNQRESEDEQASSDSPHEKYESFELGFTVMSLPIPEDPRQEELVITQVFRGSVAWEVGLRKGGVIKRVNGKKVYDIKLLERLIHRILEQKGKVTLFVAHENHTAQNYTLESKSNF